MGIKLGPRQVVLLRYTFISILVLLALLSGGCRDDKPIDPLTREERAWLTEHDGKIRLAHDPDARPIDYVDEDGQFKGLAADYVHLIEKRLNFKFDILRISTWDEAVNKAKYREVDVLCTFTKNAEREEWMLFTEPYITIPVVLLTRNDFQGNLTLDTMENMKVTFTKGWVVDDYLRSHYSRLNTVPAIDPDAAMNNLVTEKADVWATALTVASIKIEENRVTNIRMAGTTDFSFRIAMASRKDWKILNSILIKGLSQIPQDERDKIFQKWIHIGQQSIFASRTFWIIVIIVIGIAVLPVIFIYSWNNALKRKVDEKTKELDAELVERKNAQEALRFSENRYRSLVENQTDLIARFLPDGTFIFVNTGFCRFFGKSESELLGSKWQPFLFEDDLEYINTKLSEISPSYQIISVENRLKSADGTIHWVHFINIGLFDDHGTLLEIQSVGRDITERKESEEALRRSEEKYRLLADNAKDVIWIRDLDLKLIYVSPSVEKVRGYTPEEAINQNIDEVLTPDSAKLAVNTFIQMLERKEKGNEVPDEYIIELEHRCKNGDTIWMEVRISYLEDKDKKPVGMLGVSRDITDRKHAEESLKTHNQLMNTLLENLQVGVFMVEAQNGKPILVNKRAMELLGRDIANDADISSIDEINSAYKLESKELYPQEEMPIIRGMSGESHIVDDMIVVRPDGTQILLEVFGSPVRNSQGEVVASLVSFTDITERKKLMLELERIFTLSLDIICVADINRFTFIKINPAALTILGYSEEELLGRPFTEFIHPEDLDPTIKVVEDELRLGKKVINFENRYRCSDGSYRWLRWLSHPIPEEGVTYAVAHDISQIKKAEEEKELLQSQLQQAHKMEAIGTLAGGISHDFNNILQAIQGYTQLLLMDKDRENPEYGSLKAIEKSSERASGLVKQLLLFSRKAETERKPLNLNEEIDHARKMIERTIPKMIDIETHLGSRLWTVQADPVQIEQIFLNLGSNAADAMPDGGKLIIETKNITIEEDYIQNNFDAKKGDYVLLSISDTGSGVPMEILDNIFEPFFTTKEIGKGTGLGLASVYGIVKSHGGFIHCYSEPGQGTTFRIYLPAMVDMDAPEGEQNQMASLTGGTETILMVDDDAYIRDLAKNMLQRFGYEVIIAKTGEEAIGLVNDTPMDLVILDLGMPGMGGLKCLNELLKINSEAKILIASGYSINGLVKKTVESGAKGFIAKPYQLRDLLSKVRAVLDEN